MGTSSGTWGGLGAKALFGRGLLLQKLSGMQEVIIPLSQLGVTKGWGNKVLDEQFLDVT